MGDQRTMGERVLDGLKDPCDAVSDAAKSASESVKKTLGGGITKENGDYGALGTEAEVPSRIRQCLGDGGVGGTLEDFYFCCLWTNNMKLVRGLFHIAN